MSHNNLVVATDKTVQSSKAHTFNNFRMFTSQVISYIIWITSKGFISILFITIGLSNSFTSSSIFLAKAVNAFRKAVQSSTPYQRFLALLAALSAITKSDNVAHCSVNWIVFIIEFAFFMFSWVTLIQEVNSINFSLYACLNVQSLYNCSVFV